jgi:large subunit ribosomal protein L25
VLLALRTANVLIRLEGLPGGSQLALPKAVQRDAIRGSVEHVDLIMVRHGEKVTVEVPLNVTGEVAPDGLLDQQLVQISVEAEATNIPPGIEVDVEGMAIGASVHAGDLTLARAASGPRPSRPATSRPSLDDDPVMAWMGTAPSGGS